MMLMAGLIAILSLGYLLYDRFFLIKKRLYKTRFVIGCEYVFLVATIYVCVQWYNFEFTLVMAVITCGVVYLLDVLWLKKRREAAIETVNVSKASFTEKQQSYLGGMSLWVDYARSFFVVLLAVLIIRSWFFEPFRIPSGSLEPTLLVGDFIAVNKYDYGIRVPLLGDVIIPISKPKRGDIVVFHWPVKPNIDFIKRLIGLPGDKISYIDKVLYINGKKATQSDQRSFQYALKNGVFVDAIEDQENLLGVKHGIYQFTDKPAYDFKDIVVPKGMYFMMGDNRDNSGDSREWGFVSDKYLVGKAAYVVFSMNGSIFHLRKNRFWMKI